MGRIPLQRPAGLPASREARAFLGALAVYGLLALAVTWPLVTRLHDCILGYFGYEDLQYNLWLYWWWKKYMHLAALEYGRLAATGSAVAAAGALVERVLLFPFTCYIGNFVDFFFTVPLEKLAGPVFYINLKWLFILVANGAAGWLLVRRITSCSFCALLGGALVSFNPFVLYHICTGRTEQGMLFWIPLTIFFLDRALREGRLGDYFSTGLMLGLASITYWFYGEFLVIFALLYVGWLLAAREIPLRALFNARIIAGAAIFLVIVTPFLFPYVAKLNRGERLYATRWFSSFTSPEMIRQESTRFVRYTLLDHLDEEVHPSVNSAALVEGSILSSAPPFGYGVDHFSPYRVPFTLILMAVFPFFFLKKRPWFWLFAVVFFYLLSLGPFIKSAGGLVTVAGHHLPTPYLFFYKYLPFFSRLIWPERLMAMVSVAMAVLAACNVRQILSETGALRRPAVSIIAGVSLFIVFELFLVHQAPVRVTPVEIPSFYRALAQQKDGGVIEMPLNSTSMYITPHQKFYAGPEDHDSIHYYQTIHGKSFLWSDLASADYPGKEDGDVASIEYMAKSTFLRYLVTCSFTAHERDPFPSSLSFRRDDLDAVKERGYRYVVLHEKFCETLQLGARRRTFDKLSAELAKRFGEPLWKGKEYFWVQRGDGSAANRMMNPYFLERRSYDVTVYRL